MASFFWRIFATVFLLFLFAPLLIMATTAFNSFPFPQIMPWEGLTFKWFAVAFEDARLQRGVFTSVIIGSGVVLVSVPTGLAGALLLAQLWSRARTALFTILISPILIPGVVLGISTLLFWHRMESLIGFGADSPITNGLFLTVLGQSCYTSSFCMLVLLARLQRFEWVRMEAAMDLGATHWQAFKKVLLPFLKPAIGTAAILAFLSSFENYNTTIFTIGHYFTFTTEMAQRVRLGLNPSLSAIAVVIIGVTVVAALLYESWNRDGKLKLLHQRAVSRFLANRALIMFFLAIMVGLVAVAFGMWHYRADCRRQMENQLLEHRISGAERSSGDFSPGNSNTAPKDTYEVSSVPSVESNEGASSPPCFFPPPPPRVASEASK